MSTIIQDKLNAASAGSTVVLDKGSYDEIVTAPVGRSLTLDLNGSEWTCPAESTPLSVPPGADLTVVNGTISATKNACVRLGVKDATVRSTLHLGAGLKLVNTDFVAVFIAAKGDLVTECDMDVSGEDPCCIQGNGTAPYFDNTCRIIGGHLKVTSTLGESMCVYWPQVGDLVIEGGLLEGDGGVEIRAGTLTVTGGRIVANAPTYTVKTNGSGTTTNGAAVAVAQHTTKLPISVKITGGEFVGQVAFSEANPQNNSLADIAKLSATISGGTFTGGVAAVKSTDLEHFVYGGSFNYAMDTKFVAVGARMTQDGSAWVYWYPSDGGDATELSSILVDGKAVTTLQGTLIGAVDELPVVTAEGLTKGMVLYSRTDKQYHIFDGAKWSVEDMDIADSAIDQDHMDSTRPVQTKAVYQLKQELMDAVAKTYSKEETDDMLAEKKDKTEADTEHAALQTALEGLGDRMDTEHAAIEALEEKVDGIKPTVTFSGVVGNWTSTSEAGSFGYKGYIANADVKSADIATVVFGVADATSGDYAPICETAEGKVYVYSRSQGSPTVTVVVQKG